MSRSEIFNKVSEVFDDVLDDLEETLTEATTAEDVEDWDSLSHIQIITEIEKHFKVRFSTRDIEDLKNIGDMVTLIESKK